MARPAPTELAVGELFADRYQVEGVLGQGGMGTVYRVTDRSVGEIVALKVLVFGGRDGRSALDRFRREVRLSRRVTHPNIARTFDLGEREGLHYLTMELVEGGSLASSMRGDSPFSAERAAWFGREIATGLAAAHDAGVIHRDLKPQNVLLDQNERLKITDFGIARPVSEEDGVQTLGVLGTPAYMAPEQVTGDPIDARADIYALGLVMYEMVVGQRPFRGGSAMTVAVKRLDHVPQDPRSMVAVPDALAELIMECLARRPSDRPQSAREVCARLDAFLAGDVEPRRSGETRPVVPSDRTVVSTGLGSAQRSEPRLAVLPFVYRGPDEHAYLGDSFTDDLVDVLCRTRGLSVLASAATSAYRDQRDPRLIGRDLDVDAVVDGSVQRAGSSVRISARLCDARSGVQLASERWDAEITDIFDLQDKVSRRVAEALRVNLASSTTGGLRAPREAVELYLRARKKLSDMAYAGDDGALALLERALEVAPDLAPAVAAYAIACVRTWFIPELTRGRDFQSETRAAVERALALAPDLAETHMAAGLLARTEGKFYRAVQAYRKAVDIAPTYAAAVEGLGILECEAGRRERGMETLRRALELEPSRAFSWLTLAREHALDGDYEGFDRAMQIIEEGPQGKQVPMYQLQLRVSSWRGDSETAKRVFDVLPRDQTAPTAILTNYASAVLGEMSKAAIISETDKAMERSDNPRFVSFARQLAVEVCAQAGLVDAAFSHLEAVSERMLVDLSWLELCPVLAPLRDDARYPPIRARVQDRVEKIWTI